MSYGGSETGSQIATNLASAINSGSSGCLPLFSVMANGTTISITSLLKGAATNYSLSASSTYNPSCTTANGQTYCFTSPAFTASASGSSLTGGTN